MALTLQQSLRRLGQIGGWRSVFTAQDAQTKLLAKLYAAHGLTIRQTCSACPEQYVVLKDGQQVAYYRLRHGEFRVDYPDHRGETIYKAEPNGDGAFDPDERLTYLAKAMRAVLERLALSPLSYAL